MNRLVDLAAEAYRMGVEDGKKTALKTASTDQPCSCDCYSHGFEDGYHQGVTDGEKQAWGAALTTDDDLGRCEVHDIRNCTLPH